jgi:nicotinamide-nucleotide amidase
LEHELVLLANQVLSAFKKRGLSLAAAESITGGLIGHLLTEVPGSSDVFVGGVIAYHNRLKEQLGVPTHTLETEGAVSEATAKAMAEGIRGQTEADVGVAVTGIAGPGGGTKTKQVGLTYVAVSDGRGTISEAHTWRADRSTNKLLTAQAAFRLLLARVDKQSES